LSAELGEAAVAASRQEGTTLFMTLLAAFKTFLYAATDQEDLVVGSPFANRTRVETDGVMGPFVNTVVLRTWLGRDATFSELLRRVRETVLGADAHQDLPFEKVVEAVRPPPQPALPGEFPSHDRYAAFGEIARTGFQPPGKPGRDFQVRPSSRIVGIARALRRLLGIQHRPIRTDNRHANVR
jgi:non-ribosomal peptide synthetase component F